MNKKIKALFVLILFGIMTMSLISPINAVFIQKLDKNTIMYDADTGKSDIGIFIGAYYLNKNKRSKDLNRVKTVTLKLNEKNTKIFKEKTFARDKYGIGITLEIKGNVNGKNYTITTYDKQNKAIKIKKGQITSIMLWKTEYWKKNNT